MEKSENTESLPNKDVPQNHLSQYFRTLRLGERYYMTAQTLMDMIRRRERFFLMDLRDHIDFKQGHIEGAVNIPMGEMGDFFYGLPKNKKIVVTCYTGQLSGQIVGILKSLGHEAYSLYGGMVNGWQRAGYKVVHSRGE